MALLWAHRPDDGGSTHLWKVGQLLRHYTAHYPRRQASQYCQYADHEITEQSEVLDKLTVAQQVKKFPTSKWSLPFIFPTKIVYVFISALRSTCLVFFHPPLFDPF
jgi:hypothetical protein